MLFETNLYLKSADRRTHVIIGSCNAVGEAFNLKKTIEHLSQGMESVFV